MKLGKKQQGQCGSGISEKRVYDVTFALVGHAKIEADSLEGALEAAGRMERKDIEWADDFSPTDAEEMID